MFQRKRSLVEAIDLFLSNQITTFSPRLTIIIPIRPADVERGKENRLDRLAVWILKVDF
jgi:hypothetical protein